MNGKPEYSALSERDRKTVDDRVAHYQQVLQSAGATPAISLDYFVPASNDPLRLATLEQLVAVDLRHQWTHGNSVTADDFFTRFPELLSSGSKAHVAAAEFLARHEAGEQPDIDQFRNRFPDVFHQIASLTGTKWPSVEPTIDSTASEEESTNSDATTAQTNDGMKAAEPRDSTLDDETRQTLSHDIQRTMMLDDAASASQESHADPISSSEDRTEFHSKSTLQDSDAPPSDSQSEDSIDQADCSIGDTQSIKHGRTLLPPDLEVPARDSQPNEQHSDLSTTNESISKPPSRSHSEPDKDAGKTLRPDQTMVVPGFDADEAQEVTPADSDKDATLPVDEASSALPSSFVGHATVGFEGNATLATGGKEHVPPSSQTPKAGKNKSLGDGRYTLIRALGRGQYGAVWEAHAQGKVRVAIKLIQFPIGHKMTQQELRALDVIKELRHPLLVQVHAYWVEQDQLVIVMDLADKTLEGRLKECLDEGHGGIPPEELVTYVSDAADAIDFLHNQNVIHRDIKPANLLLKGQRALVGDFGLARVLERSNDANNVRATVIGTPMYMAPEVFDGNSSRFTDQYSLAVAYVELRTGRTPFHGDSLPALMKAQLTMRPDLNDLTEEEQRVLSRALSKKPEQRYPNCRDFAADLVRAFQPPQYPWLEQALKWVTAASIVLMLGLLAWLALFRFGVNVQPSVTAPAGQMTSFRIPVSRPLIPRDYELKFSPDIPGIELTASPNPDGQSSQARIHVLDSNHPAQTLEVTIDSTMSWRRKRKRFTLRIVPPEVTVPSGFTASPNAKIIDCRSGEKLFDQIECKVADDGAGINVRLILVGAHQDAIRPFYMMQDKVHSALFARFANAHPELLFDSRWQEGGMIFGDDGDRSLLAKDYPMHPVFGVTVPAALEFSKWLGGTLPSVDQWQLAAHIERWDPASNNVQVIYPFADDWEPLDDPKTASEFAVAVQREELGPLDIGAATQDVTSLGIRDLAGNGFEWTRDAYSDNRANLVDVRRFIEAKQEAWVITRGRSYMQDEPFRFRHDYLDEAVELLKDGKFYSNEETSFRVIVEP